MWFFLNLRMQRWISYWNSRLEILEAAVDPQDIRVFGGDEYRQILMHPASTYNILMVLSSSVPTGWFIWFEYSLFGG